MPTYAEKELIRKRVVDHYVKVANRCKLTTVRHFKNIVKRNTVYAILNRFEERGTIKSIKPSGRKVSAKNAENFRKFQELYKMDPMLTHSEAAQILGVPRSTMAHFRRKLQETVNSSAAEDGNVQNNEIYSSQDDIAVSEDSVVKQESANQKRQRKKTETDIQRCLICLESFQRRQCSSVKILEKNMTVVFVLKKLLNMSPEDLIKMMKNSKGRCPKDWTDFCEKCHDLVGKAIDLHGKIRKLENKLSECQEEIVRNIKNSSGLRFKKICDKEKRLVEKMVREEVINRETTSLQPNPFEEGDKEANLRVQVKREVVVVEPGEMEAPETDFVPNFDFNDVLEPEPAVPSSSVPCNTNENAIPRSNEDNVLKIDATPAPTFGVCDICGIQIRPLALPTHKLKEHGVVMEGYSLKTCTFENCKYETIYDSLFIDHQRKHKKISRHACHVCGKIFKHKQYLVKHEDIHKNAETRPYQCEICGASFAVKNYLYLHTRLSHQGRYFPSTKRKRPK